MHKIDHAAILFAYLSRITHADIENISKHESVWIHACMNLGNSAQSSARSVAPAVAPPRRPRLPSVRKRNQSSPLARRDSVGRHAKHGQKQNCLYCDCRTLSTKIVRTLFV